MPQKWVKNGWTRSNLGEKSGVIDAGSLLGSYPNIKKISKKFHFFDPHTRADPPTDPSCVVNSGSEIGLYLVLVDTSEARTASKNTFYLRIYSKNIANSMWELSFYNPSYVETFSRDIRGFCLSLQPKSAIFGPKIHHCAKYTTRSSEKPCGRHSWDPEGLSLMAN